MSLAEELRQLQELHQSGALTEEEFARAKGKALAGEVSDTLPADVPLLSHHLEQIQHQNEIERLDREWEMERETYLVSGRYGSRSIPSAGGSLLGAAIIGGFGLFWTITAASMGAPAIFPIFGAVFILVGVGSALSSFGKAGEYEQAQERYQRRRAALLAQRGEED